MKKLLLVLAVVCLMGCMEENKNDDVSCIYFLQEDFAGKIIYVVDDNGLSSMDFTVIDWQLENGKMITGGYTYYMIEDDTQRDRWTVNRIDEQGNISVVLMFYNQAYNELQADAYVNGAELSIDTRVK